MQTVRAAKNMAPGRQQRVTVNLFLVETEENQLTEGGCRGANEERQVCVKGRKSQHTLGKHPIF